LDVAVFLKLSIDDNRISFYAVDRSQDGLVLVWYANRVGM